MKTSVERRLYRWAVLLAVAQLVLFVGSWLVSSADPDLAMRSLLSPGGVRWYFGTYVHRVATPLLAWLVLGGMALSCARQSRLWQALRAACSPRRSDLSTQQLYALCISLGLLGLELAVMAALTLPAHAILLSVTGSLFPSSFSASVVPVVAFMVSSTHAVYAVLSGQVRTILQLGRLLTAAGPWFQPLLLVYCLLADLAGCVGYVVGG